MDKISLYHLCHNNNSGHQISYSLVSQLTGHKFMFNHYCLPLLCNLPKLHLKQHPVHHWRNIPMKTLMGDGGWFVSVRKKWSGVPYLTFVIDGDFLPVTKWYKTQMPCLWIWLQSREILGGGVVLEEVLLLTHSPVPAQAGTGHPHPNHYIITS